ncbi:MAG: hypothetical protein R3E97_13700 [Candidatus Eisenbacteria bacterium]
METALWSFVGPLAASRALKIVVLGTIGVLGLIFLGYALHLIDGDALGAFRGFAIVPGIPVGAAILAEMALRDGMTQRTLLYPLLGPVPRSTLAVVRTLGTAAILAIFVLIAVLVIHVLSGEGWSDLPQEALGIVLGSAAYISAFGVVHLVNRRGFVVCLAIYGLFDHAVGMLPFALRTIAPSHHLRVLGGAQDTFAIPIVLDMPEGTVFGSTLFLVVMTVLALAVTGLLFSRKPLPELC